MTEADFLKQLNQSILDLLTGDYRVKQKGFPENLSDKTHDAELRKLNQSINSLIEKFHDADSFILNLSKGNLDTEVPKSNQLISPFKELQSNLRHLVWQTHRIAEGDYNQRIDFLGDFSKSYNYLILSLREKQVLERELALNEEKYRMLAQNVSDVIWKFDFLNQHFEYVSPSVIKLLGYSVEEATQLSFDSIFTSESYLDFISVLHRKIFDLESGDESAQTFTIELQENCKNGHVIWVESVISLLLDGQSKVCELLGVSRNIEKRKEAEKVLKNYARELKESNATKDKFFSIIAHDLRNPFNALLNLTEFVVEYIENDEKDRAIAMANLLRDSAQNTYNLLQNLLEWSSMQQGGVKCNPTNELLLPLLKDEISTLENIALQKKVSVDVLFQDSLIVKADRFMLKTILRNLINNALKYSFEGGKITIDATGSITECIITISDSGIGMTQDEIDSLFKLHTSTSKPGTKQEKGSGLGLLLCSEFISMHQGKIWVESTPGSGSRFHLLFPY